MRPPVAAMARRLATFARVGLPRSHFALSFVPIARPHAPSRRLLDQKFRHAFRGAWQEVREDRSFQVHFSAAAAVIVCAAVFRVSLIEWCILLLCITMVLAAELFNSALESMAKAITDEHDPRVGAALDIGSAAVLLAAIGASIIGGSSSSATSECCSAGGRELCGRPSREVRTNRGLTASKGWPPVVGGTTRDLLSAMSGWSDVGLGC